MVVEGIDLTIESALHLHDEFTKTLLDLAKSSPGCDFKIKFSPINRIRLRRALASGTRVAASLGYGDESAAQVMRDPDFGSKFEASLKAQSKEFEAVVVEVLEIEFPTTTTPTATTTTTTPPTITTMSAAAKNKEDEDDLDAESAFTFAVIILGVSAGVLLLAVVVIIVYACKRSNK